MEEDSKEISGEDCNGRYRLMKREIHKPSEGILL
jgi:hypothetical protein